MKIKRKKKKPIQLPPQELQAWMAPIWQYTVGLLVTKHGGAVEVGTGTAIAVGDRHFIATAGHVIKNTQEVQILWGEGATHRPNSVLRLGRNVEHDVGYLEIPLCELSHCHLEQLRDLDWKLLKNDGLVHFVGMPIQHRKVGTEIYKGKKVSSQTFWKRYFGTIFLRFRDGVLHFDYRDTGFDMTTGVAKESPTDDPQGYSGCGAWALLPSKGKSPWSPTTNIILLAIEHSWNSKKRYIVATPIIRWLELIHRDYPELRSTIEESRAWEESAHSKAKTKNGGRNGK